MLSVALAQTVALAEAQCISKVIYTTMLWNAAYHALVGAGASDETFDLLDDRKETLVFYPKSDISTADIAVAGF